MCLEDRDYVSKMDEKENIKAQYYWSYENQPPKKKIMQNVKYMLESSLNPSSKWKTISGS